MMICTCATTNVHLQAWINNHGKQQACDNCGAAGRLAVDASQFAQHIDSVIRHHYEPDDRGESPLELIQRVAGVSRGTALLVTDATNEDHYPRPWFYDRDLEIVRHLPFDHWKLWDHFKEVIKHDARFFGVATREILNTILGGLTTFCEGIAIRRLTAADDVYRARLACSLEEARDWFGQPATKLLPPPQAVASAGRMNAAGIRVFYGALKEQIAVAEVQPQVDSHVVVGIFNPVRSLEVLDLGAFGNVFDCTDLFDPEFDVVSKRLGFLRILEQEISLPIQSRDEALDYIPTQVFAEYVRFVLGLDGVLYRSAQTGEAPGPGQLYGPVLERSDRNVVLFGAAALATSDPLAEGSELGLEFCTDSQQLLDVTRLEISYNRNMGAHYEPPPSDS